MAGLVDGSDDDVAENEEAHRRGNNKESDLAQATVQAGAKEAGDFVGCADGAAHDGEFGGGDGHAEEADGKRVERLRVGEGGDRAGGQPAGKKGVNVGADLHDAAADEDGKEIVNDRANVFGLIGEGKFQAAEKS